jgi:hypothetical protein
MRSPSPQVYPGTKSHRNSQQPLYWKLN